MVHTCSCLSRRRKSKRKMANICEMKTKTTRRRRRHYLVWIVRLSSAYTMANCIRNAYTQTDLTTIVHRTLFLCCCCCLDLRHTSQTFFISLLLVCVCFMCERYYAEQNPKRRRKKPKLFVRSPSVSAQLRIIHHPQTPQNSFEPLQHSVKRMKPN